ncbi:MAG: hypothetical protein COB53_04080 [Elusimicrobia bacterium]|nr:MAG: hypothetical protein COB53_04080 [Elusimicrobiota bacterium]
MPRPNRSSFDARFLLLWIFAGVCESPVIALLLGWPIRISVSVGVLLHCAAAILTFVAPPPGKGYFKPSRHWGQALGLLTFLLPGVGWICAGWLVLRNRNAPLDKEAYIFVDNSPEDANPLAAMGSQNAVKDEIADAMDVIPAVDALLSDVPGLKRGAIETLSKIQTAEAVQWIQQARSEDDPEVRFYATTALTRLKHEFETSIRAAERELYKRPDEIEPQIAFLRVRYEYAISGMLDPDACTAILEECRDKLTGLSDRTTTAARLLFLVQRKLDPDSAFDILEKLDAINPERHSRWVRDRADLLFSLGRFGEVRKLLKGYRAELKEEGLGLPEDREWRTQMLWWSDD